MEWSYYRQCGFVEKKQQKISSKLLKFGLKVYRLF